MMRHIALFLLACSVQLTVHAEQAESSGYPSVEDNLRIMDKDRDGMVTVVEVRAYIEAKHGKNYQQEVLSNMESSIRGRSCATPFANSFY